MTAAQGRQGEGTHDGHPAHLTGGGEEVSALPRHFLPSAEAEEDAEEAKIHNRDDNRYHLGFPSSQFLPEQIPLEVSRRNRWRSPLL